MIAETRTSLRRFALRLFPIACLLLVPDFARGQSAINYCEAPPAVKEDLRKVTHVNDEDLPYRARRERQLMMLQELLKKYPGDFHVQRRYQDIRRSGFFADRDALHAEYRAQMEKTPNDPVAVYLYARSLVGRQSKEAIELYTKLAQSGLPWTHLHLAEIYNTPNFRDTAKFSEHVKQWTEKCPTNLAAVGLISRAGDKELMASTAKSLRARLASSTNNDDLAHWDTLWTIEFKLKTVPEHAALRTQIMEDLKKIRAQNAGTKDWLQALQAGYKQVGDKTGERWAQDELVKLIPKSDTARSIIQTRYHDEHPYPKGDAEAPRQAYQQALVKVTSEWLKQWPNDERAWSTRVNALTQLEAATGADVEAAYNGYAKAHDESGNSYSLPPLEVAVARFYLKGGYKLESVPVLLQKGITEIEQIEKNNARSDLYPVSQGAENTNLRFVHLESWPLMAEAYGRLKQPDKAREVLALMADTIKAKAPREQLNDSQKRSLAYNQAMYWQAVGKVAEGEQRKLDALMAYQTALTFHPDPSGGPRNRENLKDITQRLWKSLGGTDDGWTAYLARNEGSKSKFATAETASWDSKNTLMASFDLSDLQGRKWSLADLKGKVAFINLWATWCGPCRAELPYLQKLAEQLKDRKDVLILTLNIDQEIGLVEPFMKENKYSFPVLLGQTYAEGQGVNSIPRNWIVSSDGKIMFEGVGFGNDGEEWMKRATQMIEKVKGSN